MQDGHYRAAEKICRDGITIIPRSFSLRGNLAACLAKQGRREEAIAELDKALLLFPDNKILEWNRQQIATSHQLNVRMID